jgi:molybdopterin synthase catalytic subunit
LPQSPDATITVHLRYFAIFRQRLGRGQEDRAIPAGTTVGQLFDDITGEQPALAVPALRAATMLMVNQDYADPGHELRDGDEVVFVPPVSGGNGGEAKRFLVTADELDPRVVEALVATPAAGAIITFTGTVRDNARGAGVSELVYEAYEPAAERQLAVIADEIAERWAIPVEQVAVHHRIGRLGPGVASVVICVASAHRDEGYEASRHMIERIKQIVPIWKEEHYADGAVWIGSEAAYQDLPDRRP